MANIPFKYYLLFGSIWFLTQPLLAQEPEEFNKDTVSVNEAVVNDSAALAPADSAAVADSLSNKKEKKEKKIELKTTRKIRGILSRISGYVGTGYGHYNYRSNLEGRGVTTVGDTTYIFQHFQETQLIRHTVIGLQDQGLDLG